MSDKEDDKITLKSTIDMVYISPRFYKTKEGSETEVEIRDKLESFKKWAYKLINEKFNK